MVSRKFYFLDVIIAAFRGNQSISGSRLRVRALQERDYVEAFVRGDIFSVAKHAFSAVVASSDVAGWKDN